MHALQEARRVLAPAGTLIDLRPICVDAPLEILTPQGSHSAGLVDMSPDIADDIAADNTFKEAVAAGSLKQVKLEEFDFAYYWETVDGMKADFEDRWKDDAILPAGVLRKARRLFKAHGLDARVRLRIRMRLSAYRQA